MSPTKENNIAENTISDRRAGLKKANKFSPQLISLFSFPKEMKLAKEKLGTFKTKQVGHAQLVFFQKEMKNRIVKIYFNLFNHYRNRRQFYVLKGYNVSQAKRTYDI